MAIVSGYYPNNFNNNLPVNDNTGGQDNSNTDASDNHDVSETYFCSLQLTTGTNEPKNFVAQTECPAISTDPCCKDIRYSIAVPPQHGTATIVNAQTGEVRYEPNAGYFGQDCFELVLNCSNPTFNPESNKVRVCIKVGACQCEDIRLTVIKDCPQSYQIVCPNPIPDATSPNAAVVYSLVTDGAKSGVETVTVTPTGWVTLVPAANATEGYFTVQLTKGCDACCIIVYFDVVPCVDCNQDIVIDYCTTDFSEWLPLPECDCRECCRPTYTATADNGMTVEIDPETKQYRLRVPDNLYGFAGTVRVTFKTKCINGDEYTDVCNVDINHCCDDYFALVPSDETTIIIENYTCETDFVCSEIIWEAANVPAGVTVTLSPNNDGSVNITITRPTSLPIFSFNIVKKCASLSNSCYGEFLITTDCPEGHVDVNGNCLPICDEECEDGICINGVCYPECVDGQCPPGLIPTILNIDGVDICYCLPDCAVGCPDSGWVSLPTLCGCVCLPICTDGQCPPGYHCFNGVCFPICSSTGTCQDGWVSYTTPDGVCICVPQTPCSQECIDGWEQVEVCAGVCICLPIGECDPSTIIPTFAFNLYGVTLTIYGVSSIDGYWADSFTLEIRDSSGALFGTYNYPDVSSITLPTFITATTLIYTISNIVFSEYECTVGDFSGTLVVDDNPNPCDPSVVNSMFDYDLAGDDLTINGVINTVNGAAATNFELTVIDALGVTQSFVYPTNSATLPYSITLSGNGPYSYTITSIEYPNLDCTPISISGPLTDNSTECDPSVVNSEFDHDFSSTANTLTINGVINTVNGAAATSFVVTINQASGTSFIFGYNAASGTTLPQTFNLPGVGPYTYTVTNIFYSGIDCIPADLSGTLEGDDTTTLCSDITASCLQFSVTLDPNGGGIIVSDLVNTCSTPQQSATSFLFEVKDNANNTVYSNTLPLSYSDPTLVNIPLPMLILLISGDYTWTASQIVFGTGDDACVFDGQLSGSITGVQPRQCCARVESSGRQEVIAFDIQMPNPTGTPQVSYIDLCSHYLVDQVLVFDANGNILAESPFVGTDSLVYLSGPTYTVPIPADHNTAPYEDTNGGPVHQWKGNWLTNGALPANMVPPVWGYWHNASKPGSAADPYIFANEWLNPTGNKGSIFPTPAETTLYPGFVPPAGVDVPSNWNISCSRKTGTLRLYYVWDGVTDFVRVVVLGNPKDSGTIWNMLPACPLQNCVDCNGDTVPADECTPVDCPDVSIDVCDVYRSVWVDLDKNETWNGLQLDDNSAQNAFFSTPVSYNISPTNVINEVEIAANSITISPEYEAIATIEGITAPNNSYDLVYWEACHCVQRGLSLLKTDASGNIILYRSANIHDCGKPKGIRLKANVPTGVTVTGYSWQVVSSSGAAVQPLTPNNEESYWLHVIASNPSSFIGTIRLTVHTVECGDLVSEVNLGNSNQGDGHYDIGIGASKVPCGSVFAYDVTIANFADTLPSGTVVNFYADWLVAGVSTNMINLSGTASASNGVPVTWANVAGTTHSIEANLTLGGALPQGSSITFTIQAQGAILCNQSNYVLNLHCGFPAGTDDINGSNNQAQYSIPQRSYQLCFAYSLPDCIYTARFVAGNDVSVYTATGVWLGTVSAADYTDNMSLAAQLNTLLAHWNIGTFTAGTNADEIDLYGNVNAVDFMLDSGIQYTFSLKKCVVNSSVLMAGEVAEASFVTYSYTDPLGNTIIADGGEKQPYPANDYGTFSNVSFENGGCVKVVYYDALDNVIAMGTECIPNVYIAFNPDASFYLTNKTVFVGCPGTGVVSIQLILQDGMGNSAEIEITDTIDNLLAYDTTNGYMIDYASLGLNSSTGISASVKSKNCSVCETPQAQPNFADYLPATAPELILTADDVKDKVIFNSTTDPACTSGATLSVELVLEDIDNSTTPPTVLSSNVIYTGTASDPNDLTTLDNPLPTGISVASNVLTVDDFSQL